MRRFYFLIIILCSVLTATLVSCGLIPDLGCDIKMTNEYIHSTCGLYNGVRFEELQVDSFYDDRTPKLYRVVVAFEGRIDESKTKDLERIYFNDPSGKYYWSIDTSTHEVYHKWGIHRERVDIRPSDMPDTTMEIEVMITKDSSVRFGGKPTGNPGNYHPVKHFVCPIKFKPATWYFLNFFDQRYEAYLYVDQDMNYKIEKISLPTNF